MRNDYLTLRGKRFRVEVTYGAIRRFCEAKGINNLDGLVNLGNLSFNDTELLVYNCLAEGAEFDQKNLPFTIEQLPSWLRPVDIKEFMSIFKNQSEISDTRVQKKSIIKALLSRLRSMIFWKKR